MSYPAVRLLVSLRLVSRLVPLVSDGRRREGISGEKRRRTAAHGHSRFALRPSHVPSHVVSVVHSPIPLPTVGRRLGRGGERHDETTEVT